VYVHLRVYADLVELAGATEHEVPVGDPRSVKDLIESVGIPHPEVALVLVDGTPVTFDQRVAGGERVAVFPPFNHLDLAGVTTVEPPPLPVARFVCDVHLGTLARRLRLLGFDTWYRTDADDVELARVAVTERRILLTRDRGLLMRRSITHGYCPRSDDGDLQVFEVLRRFRLVSQVAPLTRCIRCNGPLQEATLDEVREQLPPRTRQEFESFARCDDCGQVYWPGSHVDAVAGFLAEVADLDRAHP
jgi:uncharacterized protein